MFELPSHHAIGVAGVVETEHSMADITQPFPFIQSLIFEHDSYVHPSGKPIPGGDLSPFVPQHALDKARRPDHSGEETLPQADHFYVCMLGGDFVERMYDLHDSAGSGMGAILQRPGLGASLTRLVIHSYWADIDGQSASLMDRVHRTSVSDLSRDIQSSSLTYGTVSTSDMWNLLK